MEKTAIDQMNEILKSKGQYVGVSFKSEVQPSAKFKSFKLEKRTRAVVRAGINYANLKTVKEGIENGERGEVQPIWNGKGQWVNFPYLLQHVDSKEFYLRLYPSQNNIPQVDYLVNGVEVTKDHFMEFLTPSKVREMTERHKGSETAECFTIKTKNILDIKE
jgi:hypothetical protein